MKEKRKKLEILKRFLNPLFENTKTTLQSVIFYGIWAIGPLLHIYFAQRIVGNIEAKNKEEFFFSVGLYFGVLFLYYLSGYLTRFWGHNNNISFFRRTIHNFYIDKFVKLSNTQTEKIGTGKLISIIGTGMDMWAVMLNKVLEFFMKIVFTIAFTIYTISVVNIWAAIIFIILYVLMHIIGEYFNKKTLIHRRKRQDVWNIYNGSLVKILMSKFEILQTGQIGRELKNINEINDKMYFFSQKMATPLNWFYYIPSIFINLVKIGMFLFLGYGVILGDFSMALFVAMFGIMTLMNNVIINSMTFYGEFTKNFTKIEKMWDFFDETKEIEGYEKGLEFVYKSGDIELKNMTFSYEENKNIFENFSLKLPGKKVYAFVGNSGSGKSTLVKLIAGYLKQNSGEIIIDNQNLKEISLKNYYKSIGYLTQEPSVFDGTILDNLTYGIGKSEKNIDEKIKEIIKKAKCEFIYDFKDGINTEIGEKGIRLSGGQRQRLAIAKIMLKDPKIIILDEPTSALDSFSEEKITKAMNNLFSGRTVIVIAHRLQTVKHADKIFVFENGQIVEEGNHNDLVRQNGIYNKMLELQSGF